MILNLFGRSIEINVRKKTSILNKAKNKFKEKYIFRIVTYLLIVSFFMLFSMIKVGKDEYRVGQIAKNDVIAHIDKEYERNFLDEELKTKIEQNTIPEFDRIENVDKTQIDRLDSVLQALTTLDLKKNNEIRQFIKNYGLKISIADLKNIAIKQNVKYYIYLINVLEDIYNQGIVKKEDLNKVLADNQIVLNDIEKKFILNFIEPNLKINKEKTLKKIEKNIQRLAESKVVIKKGDLILKKGDVITSLDYDNLDNLGYISRHDIIIRNLGKILIYAIVSFFFFKFSEKYFKKSFENKGFYPFLITTIIADFIYILLPDFINIKLLAPMMLIPIIGIVLLKEYIFSLYLLSINYIFVVIDVRWAFVLIVLSMIAMYLNESITSRNELIKNSIYLGLMQTIFVFSLFLYYNIEVIDIIPGLIFSLLSGIFTGVLSIGILPYFENTFKILTDIKLLELSNFSNPLLKKLLLTAPGTFHHSLMVGALAEAGAEAIGANPILCRVASYYHDIGKMKRPMYFVENQVGIENPHNSLKATLSTLIITSHTKDGYLLGKKHDLPDEILDIILEHHGTTLVQYFYYKALSENQNVEEVDFRYSGPKPSTKESGVVMLADTIEAAVRATPDKSSDNIEKLIRYLIKSKVEDRQLCDCNITLEEIEKVTQAFLKMLKGIYHERIQYLKGK